MEHQEKEDSYSHILKYTSLFGGVQGLSILVGLVRNKLVAMILGPDGMGLVSLFNSTIKLVSDSTGMGLSMSGVKAISEAYETHDGEKLQHQIRLIRQWSLIAAVLGLVVCAVMSPLLNRLTFDWGDHTVHFILLSPVVAMMAVTTGETAILKATRQLRHLAALSVYSMLAALVISVPLYYIWWEAAIVPSLILLALSQMLLTIGYSWKLYPYKLELSGKLTREGLGMLRLGMAFVVAGILGSGADFVIRSYLNNVASLHVVGLFNAGYVMTMTYAGLVFSAMETDYFPRISGIPDTGAELNHSVNNQIEVTLLILSPLLVVFMTALPLLLPLLYSTKFVPVLGMMKLAVLAMYFRAVTLPIEYVALSRADSLSYLLLEAIYDVAVVGFVILGYSNFGLWGTGLALLFAGIFNLVVVLAWTRHRYGYHLSKGVIAYAGVLIPLGFAAYGSLLIDGIVGYLLASVMAVLSAIFSIVVLRKKTNLWERLRQRLMTRLKRQVPNQDKKH